MGFYYGPEPPKEEPPQGSWKETLLIIWVVFKGLALPLGLLFGGIIGLMVVLWAFLTSVWLGLALLALAIGAVVAREIWEARHPPDLP
jgi:hypothetical protein